MSRGKKPRVIVVDAQRQYVETISPAVARRLLRDQKVTMLRKRPCTVQLAPSNVRPDAFERVREVRKMATKYGSAYGANGFVNFTEFFREEKDVWVQNIGRNLISLEFDSGNGNKIGKLIPRVSDPINLSREVPWDAIKNSADFRKQVMRNPKIMKLLTAQEAEEWFARKAASNKKHVIDQSTGQKIPDVGWAMADAERRINKQINPVENPDPIVTTDGRQMTVDGLHNGPRGTASSRELDDIERGVGPGAAANIGKDGHLELREVVNPRVLHLCQQVSYELSPAERMPARELLDELQSMEDHLTLEDVNHIQSFGTYKPVKAWARQQATRIASEQDLGGEDDGTLDMRV